MADWSCLARESLASASSLLEEGRHRSCISRAYYAAYAAVTSELMNVKGLSQAFYHKENNPSHGQVVGMLDQLVQRGWSTQRIRDVKQSMRTLRRKREEADYMPGHAIDASDARTCRRFAASVISNLKIDAGDRND